MTTSFTTTHCAVGDGWLSAGRRYMHHPRQWAIMGYELRPVGHVESGLTDPAVAPKQGVEGGPDAWLVFEEEYEPAMRELAVGDRIHLITWLHLADRSVLRVHPRDDESQPMHGVFDTRSQDRPNPLGLHTVTVLAVEGKRVLVNDLDAIDGTPVVDVKPVLLSDWVHQPGSSSVV